MADDDPLQRAVRLHLSGDIAAAARQYRHILAGQPRHPDALHLLGLAHLQQGRPSAAVTLIEKAIAVNPQVAAFHGNRATALLALGKPAEARRAYERAVAVDPAYAEGWRNLGSLCARLDDHEAAAAAYERLAKLTGGRDGQALGYQALSLAVMCEWERLDALRPALVAAAQGAEGVPVPPFALLIHDLPPEALRHAADHAAAFIRRRALGSAAQALQHPRRPRSERLRIGYLSEDFHEHATAYLIAEMLEGHDRARFETFAYSYGPDDRGAMRQRLRAGVDHFVDIGPMNARQAAQRILADRIDILVDLKGHTGQARTDILALRPAPVTVAYLGYPGTFGGDYVDYILADGFVVPPGEEANFSEAVIRLPFCYQANDAKRPRAAARPAKAEWGLPAEAQVLCVFNNSFKIGAPTYALWLDLLARHDRAVLWFIDCHPRAAARLGEAAGAHGIAAERLIFAPRLAHERHMLRIGAADLFLDTYPYGGHTTASDALWAGVPVVTRTGRAFASRVAGSLLHALDLDQLIAADPDGYRAIADRLLAQPKELAALRRRVEEAVAASPLFDGRRFARDLERAYDEIWRRFAAGLAPEGFTLNPGAA